MDASKPIVRTRRLAGMTFLLGSMIAAALIMPGAAALAASCSNPGPGDPAQGKSIYDKTCISCHGKDGTGQVPGTPDFTSPDGPLSKPKTKLTSHIENGFKKPGAPLAMPPKGGNPNLTKTDIMNVEAYIRQTFYCSG